MLGGLTGFWFRFSRNSSASRRLHRTSADMKTHLPERWTEYSAVGRRIPGTRFISFKVPLQKVFENKLAPLQRFSPSDLLREMEKQKEELGLVVDLTFTKRYYSPQEFPASVKYVKIFTAGKQVPSDDVIYEFKCLVKRFLSENAENDKLVGVHCTHGLNRTGYLVCRYMIDVLGVVPSEAIERFNKSRGHCIERENYLDDLLEGKPRRYPFINHRPRIPPPGFPHPPLPGHRIPQTDLRGGPQRHRHHPKRYFAQQPDDRPVNGAPGWHPTPPNYGDSIDSRGSGPQGRNGPYSRWPGQGHRGSHGEQ
ncbi:RNA/RNP complex-1-interacting phosphatase isoform X3 [Rana temporaria]|uniref:RNA/RNP complex-1-interacting phosphatase isoform X3 n=1 Tax=Rana temporaria TaxID=8407 RepID=UPI001AAC974C|nr:RNA/RNP complex-1-interacting phosphatase isoform X3 [Rana temporaria]